MFESPGLAEKVVIVTGGSRGIGREIVLRFVEERALVTFTYQKNGKLAEELCALAAERGPRPVAVQADVRDREACERLAVEVRDRCSRIDVLVNNAGVVRDNLAAALSDEEIRDVLDTNVVGVFNLVRAVLPVMLPQRSGKIINVGSVAASKAGRGQSNYAASKGAIESLTRALAVELAPKKILVNAVAPGVIETDMSRSLLDLAGDEVRKKVLVGRLGRPEDVAPAVLFLASRFGDYINGEVLHVDGGFKMD